MKISIVGLPGSGKSTLANSISAKFSIPHIQIDRFWFEAGGRRGSRDTPDLEQVRAHVKEKVMRAVNAGSWVSDGFYRNLQPEIASRADVIVFLDISLWRRLLNHANRFLFRSNRHPETGVWSDLVFFFEVVRRTYTNGPRIRKFVDENRGRVTTLRSRKEIQDYLRVLH